MRLEPQANWLRWAIPALGFGVIWLVLMALFGPKIGSSARLSPPRLLDAGSQDSVDWNWVLRDRQDQPVPFASFRGHTIVLNLWATWCPPCLAELPSLAALAENTTLKAQGVEVVCVSTDQSPEALVRYLDGKPWKMTVVRATELPSAFLADGLPTTFVLAPDGRIVATELGPARWDDPSVVAFLGRVAASK